MKTIKSICLTLLLATTVAARAADEPFRTDINPALLYYQGFLLEPDLESADRDFLFTNQWRGVDLPQRFGNLLARYVTQFKVVRQAAHATVPCDWGIDLSPGPAALLPQLARSKRTVQTAQLRAMWSLQVGRQAQARDDLLATLALGRNVSRDGTLISALVQIAAENIVCSTIAETFHQFSPATLQELADGFAAAPPRGLMAACFATEKAGFHDWLVGRIMAVRKEHPGNDAEVMAKVRELFASMLGGDEKPKDATKPSPWDQTFTASGGTSEGLLKLLKDEEPLYDRLAVVMALPHREYERQAGPLSAEISQTRNPIVALSMPAFEKARTKEFMIEVELAMLRAAIEYKLHGEDGLKSVLDPCGQDPFKFQRFAFEGVDRGFQLTSAYRGRGYPEVLICVEKAGPAFYVNGEFAGKPVKQ